MDTMTNNNNATLLVLLINRKVQQKIFSLRKITSTRILLFSWYVKLRIFFFEKYISIIIFLSFVPGEHQKQKFRAMNI